MISVIKFRVCIDSEGAIRFSVVRKKTIKRTVTNHLLPDLLVWGAERIRLQNADRLV